VLHDVVRDAPEERSQGREAARAEHDQVDRELVGGREDRGGHIVLVGDRDPARVVAVLAGDARALLGQQLRLFFRLLVQLGDVERDGEPVAEALGPQRLTDVQSGLLERFRSPPMARSAVLTERTIADLFETCS
jgi:hypothetical protein